LATAAGHAGSLFKAEHLTLDCHRWLEPGAWAGRLQPWAIARRLRATSSPSRGTGCPQLFWPHKCRFGLGPAPRVVV